MRPNAFLVCNRVAFFRFKRNDDARMTLRISPVAYLYNKKKWTLEKTYRDIETLHSELSKILPQIPSFSSFSLFINLILLSVEK